MLGSHVRLQVAAARILTLAKRAFELRAFMSGFHVYVKNAAGHEGLVTDGALVVSHIVVYGPHV